MKPTRLLYVYVFSSALMLINAQDDEKILTELELIGYDLADACSQQAAAEKKFDSDHPGGLEEKIASEQYKGKSLRTIAANLARYSENVPYEVERNYTQLTKSGDYLLPGKSYADFISYANSQLERLKTTQVNWSKLSSSRNLSEIKELWDEWRLTRGDHDEFRATLDLIPKAAQLNGQYNVKTYWEMLVDVQDAHEKSDELWEEIQPLYAKLEEFVRKRLNKHYNATYEAMPVYLLGSRFGEDWSAVADLVMPHPQLYQDVKTELGVHSSRQFYKHAENLTKSFGLGSLGKHFWTHSGFEGKRCDHKIYKYCAELRSEILTCAKPTLNSYMDAHRAAMEITVDQRDYTGLPQRDLRHSPALEALKDMAELFALNNLHYHGLLDPDVYTGDAAGANNRNSMLLLVALRLLPRLAYYKAADEWRLQEAEEASDDMVRSWWEIRKKYQLIEGDGADFVDDEEILYNRPYLAKFFAVFLQFQLMNYHQINLFGEMENPAKVYRGDSSFREMIDSVRTRSSVDLVSYYYSIDSISAYPMTEFLSPLMDYLENAPETNEPYVIKPAKTKPVTEESVPKRKPRVKIVTTTTTESAVQNDQTDTVAKQTTVTEPPEVRTAAVAEDKNRYLAPIIILVTMVSLIALIAWKKFKSKPRTNNRRQDDDV